jgi:hypothetical protein
MPPFAFLGIAVPSNADISEFRFRGLIAGYFTRPSSCLILGIAIGLAIGICSAAPFLVRGLYSSRSESAPTRPFSPDSAPLVSANRDGSTARDSAQEAIGLVIHHLQAGQVQYAYDALLAAMRIAPSDQAVFQASLDFIRKASATGNDDSMVLADDVYERAANLIPFLPLAQLEKARKDHTTVGNKLHPLKPGANQDNPLAESERLLDAVNVGQPSFVRARLLREVETELGNESTQFASSQTPANNQDQFWKRWKTVKDRYDKAESALLADLYRETCQPQSLAWLKKVRDSDKEFAEVGLENIHQANSRILDLISDGQRITRDLAPYLEAGVPTAVQENQQDALDNHLVRLSQLREWNYNRWALNRVERVEQSGGDNLEKLKSLAVLDESRLAPYVAQRFAEVWKKFFEECSKDDKVEATKLRILREYQK